MGENMTDGVGPTQAPSMMVPLSDDGKSVFIDGFGEVPLAYPDGVTPCGEAQPLVWQFKVGGGQWQECSEKNARAYREQGAPFKVRALREVATPGVAPSFRCLSTTADGRSCRSWCGDAKCAAGVKGLGDGR